MKVLESKKKKMKIVLIASPRVFPLRNVFCATPIFYFIIVFKLTSCIVSGEKRPIWEL